MSDCFNMLYKYCLLFSLLPFALGSSVRPGTLSSSATVKVQVGQSGVVAVIASWSSETMSSTKAGVVDASQSYDIDYPAITTGLSYAWSCIVSAPSYGQPCGTMNMGAITTPVVSLPAGSLAPGKTYQFTVTVSKNAGAFTSTASRLLTVVNEALPVLAMQPVSIKYNPGDKIVLSCSITVTNVSTAFWTSTNMTSSTLSSIMLTPAQTTVTAGTTTFQLAIAPGSLVQGLTYNFQLNCAYSASSTTAFASVVIVMNQPPR